MKKIKTTVLVAVALTIGPTAGYSELIHLQAKLGKLDGVVAELDKGTPVDLPATSMTTVDGVSPLYVAAEFGYAEIVAELLKRGANPNQIFGSADESWGVVGTPLHAAARNGHADVIALLIEGGADINISVDGIGTPLHMARTLGLNTVEEALVANGAIASQEASSIMTKIGLASLERGSVLAQSCASCHGEASPIGGHGPTAPNLWGILQREAGSAQGYSYSLQLSQSDFTWTADNLNSYLASPTGFLPGTKKSGGSLVSEQDRIDILTFIATNWQ